MGIYKRPVFPAENNAIDTAGIPIARFLRGWLAE
jgi:hypothetical protein